MKYTVRFLPEVTMTLNLMITIVSYFSHCCDQIPDQNRRAFVLVQFERVGQHGPKGMLVSKDGS